MNAYAFPSLEKTIGEEQQSGHGDDAMKCQNCGVENPDSKVFCGDCGLRLSPPTCPKCGAENPEGKKFCGDCGADISEPGSPAIQPPTIVRRNSSERPNLRRIGRAAWMIGLAVLFVSVILFVLSNALEHQAHRLALEDSSRWSDVEDMANFTSLGAWITLGVAIVCIAGGAIAYTSGET